jgi:long-chain acyl-CoA synthetase
MPGQHPSFHARTAPESIAMLVADTGEQLTYRALDDGSNRVAQWLRAQGLKPGDRIGVMMRNSASFAIVYWGATRCGMFVTLLSTHLKPEEAAYILGDSQSQLLILSASLGETPRALAARREELIPGVRAVFYADEEPLAGAASLAEAIAAHPA